MATVSQVTYDDVARHAAEHALGIMGGLHDNQDTILLLGPAQGFWELFQTSPEMQDGEADPVDRWSARVVTGLANRLGAKPHLPFGGPPYAPFLSWALASGRAWSSPVGMLVHDEAGMMISFRGALHFAGEIPLPAPPAASPCEDCVDRPCITACPVGALSDTHFYKTDACHDYLDTHKGQECMTGGCIARLACPVSQRFDRPPAQSAHHMRYFHRS